MNTDEKTAIFEKAPIKKAVIKQIVPAVITQMIALIYSLADTYFVGKQGDARQTAAIMVISSPFLLLTAVSNLFGIGGATAISHKLGEKKFADAQEISSAVFWLGVFGGTLTSLIAAAFLPNIITLCGGTTETQFLCYEYAKWVIVYGGVFAILSPILSNVLRAEGRVKTAAIGVTLGGLLNVILDPFFVLPCFLNLGVVGAGMATAISNLVSTIFLVAVILARRNLNASLALRHIKKAKAHILEILAAGFPSALQYALTVVAVAAQSKFVSAYGSQAVAALGIVKKLDQLPLYFSIGVSTGILPMLAYNHSAKNEDRLKKAFKLSCAISLTFSVICLIVYELFAPLLAAVFIKDDQTVSYAASFLRRMVTAMPMMSVCYPMIIKFQATGKIKQSVLCSLLRKGVIDIPLLYIADSISPLYGLMWVQPIVDCTALSVAVILNKRSDG